MSEDWDVDSYKTEHENEEHWELRRNFMLAHKDKFSEDELVCLAQVFTNIEFMGCRYPDKTMIRVAELAKGVVEKFREQRKNSLKRTFVAASDAATAKVKGQGRQGEELGRPSNKIAKMTFVEEKSTIESEEGVGKLGGVIESITRVPKYGGVKTFNIGSKERMETDLLNRPGGPLGDLVLILDNEGDHPVSTLQRTAALNKCAVRWDFEDGGGIKTCKLYLKNEHIATGSGVNAKISKEMAAIAGIERLRESCYGIRVKSRFFSSTTVNPAHLGSSSKASADALGEDNIGRKLLKLMGWQGGGLGNKGQGREEPVLEALQVRRDGFGLKANASNAAEFKKKARDYIRNWMNGDSDQDLVFSSEFTSEERKAMHEVASSFSLKSKSYGKDGNRQLVISRRSEPWDIVQELKKAGGTSDKYELLHPKNA